MTAQEIQEAFNSIFKDLSCKDTVEVYEVEGGVQFRIISEAFNWDLEDVISFFLFDKDSLKGEEVDFRLVERLDEEIRSYVLTLSPTTQEYWEDEGWDKIQKHFRENGFTVYEVARTFSRAKLEETLERHAKDPQEVTRYLAAEKAEFERKRLVSQAKDFVEKYKDLSEPCRVLVREKIGVADRAILLERIEQLEKASQGYIAREVGYLLLAQSLAGVKCEAVRASARSKLEGEYPDLAKHWDF